MSQARLLSSALIALLVFSVCVTNAKSDEETSALNGFTEPNVRKEFGGRDNTPDHLMFAFLVRHISGYYEEDAVLARSIVMDNMRTGPVEAEVYIRRMLATREQMDESAELVRDVKLCNDAAGRSRPDIYRALTTLDDEKFRIGEIAYNDFRKTLGDAEKQSLKLWLNDSKDGYRHIQLDHSKLYEESGIDVATHVQTLCNKAAERRARMSQ